MKKPLQLAVSAIALACVLIARSQFGRSHLGLDLMIAAVLGILIISIFIYTPPSSEERKRNFRRLLGIRRPEETRKRIFQTIGCLLAFFSPVLIFLKLGARYVLLDGSLYNKLAYVLVILFCASFAVPAVSRILKPYPLWARLAARLGFCMPVLAALFSIALAVNCVRDNSVRTREVVCLGMRASFGSNPVYYVRIRPWGDTDRDVEIDVSRGVFRKIHVGSGLSITTSPGRLGFEWIRNVEAVSE